MDDSPASASLVTVATFVEAHAAHLARSRLEAEGIMTFVADDATVQLNWFLSPALEGVKVRVAAVDEARARAILREDRALDVASMDAMEFGIESDAPWPRRRTAPSTGKETQTVWLVLTAVGMALGLAWLYVQTRPE